MEKISITDAIEQLQDYLSLKGLSPNTHRAYLADLRTMWQEMGLEVLAPLDLERTAAAWLNRTKRSVAAKQVAAKTAGRRLTSMRALGLAFGQPILAGFSTPTPPEMQPHPLPGGKDDIVKMLNHCGEIEHKVLVVLTGLCGERVSEARKTSPSDFHLKTQEVDVYGKGDKKRTVPVSNFAWGILLPVIIERTLDGRATAPLISISDRTARGVITALGVRAGVERPISSHDMRATFATEAYDRTKDIRAVQYLLGHASITQTQQYVLSFKHAQRAAANFMEDED